ncbi:hypothetical protein CALCODRAFT_475243 [Calocera cornea HHB12733]|uniref:Uncharacterized protein n=1 Tax=Calocera cornea HHB12733 TaxID=1353952 RepID=A0A165DK82_9BASI|nr:hypothetical protein CALCODRAFT_475243 [Calocera cornea HHB12733]
MASRWHWDLSLAEGVLKLFNDLFKSRKFSNLDSREERKADFATFLTSLDIQLLSDLEGSDTAYGLFLKLLAGATDALRAHDSEKKAVKLLGAFIPVGVVTFTKERPPTRFELSQLYNRYSAILLAIYLEPSSAPRRIESARRILDFARADSNSRQVCLRAVMYLGILLRHLGLNLQPAAQWTTDMMELMLAEFPVVPPQESAVPLLKDAQAARDEAEMMICVLLRSITRVIKISSLDALKQDVSIYPDPIFLSNSWLYKILRSASYVKSAVSSEALRYIQAFLDQRSGAMSGGPGGLRVSRKDEESQDYGDADYDFDDPDFLLMLEAAESSGDHPAVPAPAEKNIAQIIDKELSPAIFQLISNMFANGALLPLDQWPMVDAAVDCWAGCGQVLVSNHIRDWTSYVGVYGAESYTRLMNKADRRRVGLRLMYKAISLEPDAYKRCQEELLSMWCQTIIRPKLTLEDGYTKALLHCDGAKHGLLKPLFSGDTPRKMEKMDISGLEACRLDFIDGECGLQLYQARCSFYALAILVHAKQVLAASPTEPAQNNQKRITAAVIREIVPALKDYYWVRTLPLSAAAHLMSLSDLHVGRGAREQKTLSPAVPACTG